MDGIYFYWFSWVFWIIITFLMPKGKHRTTLAVWILTTITVSNLYISINSLEISMSYLVIFLGCFISFAMQKRFGIRLFSAFTLMIGYTSVLIWEAHAPVWIFMPRLLIIPIVCVFLIAFISKGTFNRLSIATLGLCGGELLYSFMLSRFSIQQSIGELLFLDTLLVVLFLLICMEGVRMGRDKLFLSLQAYKQQHLRWQNE